MIGLLYNILIGLLLISPTILLTDNSTTPDEDMIAEPDPSTIGLDQGPTIGYFNENKGQYPTDHEFCSSLSYGTIYFSPTEVLIIPYKSGTLSDGGEGNEGILRYGFPGANIVSPEGEGDHSHLSNFFLGNDPSSWVTGVRSYRSIIYMGLWDHIDLRYILGDQGLKYEFIVHPGGLSEDINVQLNGGDLSMLPNGDLNVKLQDGRSIQDRNLLVHYREDLGETINAEFRILSKNRFSFDLADHDRSRTVVIDPLLTSTFIGAGSEDYAYDQVVDENFNVYITGKTRSALFPALNNPYDPSYNNNWDAYVVKYDPMDSAIEFATFLGGGDYDSGMGIALDGNGDILVTGPTYSNMFPVTPGCNRSTPIGGEDLFISRFSPDGSTLLASTYAGGTGRDISYDIVVDDTSSVYITGMTESADLPTSLNGMNRTINGGEDVFILKMDPDLSSIVYSSYMGGTGDDRALSMKIDDDDILYLTGSTDSADFPITIDHYGLGAGTQTNVFITTFGVFTSQILRSTLVGDTGQEEGKDIYIDQERNIYVTGSTTSDSFPTTANAYDISRNGMKDGFLFKTDRYLATIMYSSFIGGSKDDTGMGIGMDNAGRLLLAITTESADMPMVEPIHDETHNGKRDTYLAALNPNLGSIYRSTYIGGGEDDEVTGLSVDGDGNACILGFTESEIYPTVSGAYDASHNGKMDVFVTVVNLSYPPSEPSNPTFSYGDGYVDLQWYAPEWDGNSPLIDYRVYRRSDNETEFTLLATTDVNGYLDESITNGVIYHYYITAANHIDESMPSVIVTVSDTEDPHMVRDLTMEVAMAGRPFTFSMEVTDNVLVSAAYVTYKQDHISTMGLEKGEGNNWTGEVYILESLNPIVYNFSCHDPSMNWVYTPEKTVLIRDVTLPEFIEDETDGTCVTGDPITFSIQVQDNIDIAEVWMEYRSSSTPPDQGNISMEGPIDGHWSVSIQTEHMLTDYSYLFHAADSSGNWNSTGVEGIVRLLDEIDPVIGNDTTPDSIELEVTLRFSVEVTDNVEVSAVKVFYTINDGLPEWIDMAKDDLYHATLPANGDPGTQIKYYIFVEDSSGNWVEGEVRTITVVDLKPPVMISDGTPVNFTNGKDMTFIVELDDDHMIDEVFVEYWFGDGAHTHTSMEGENPFLRVISIGVGRYDDLHYVFHFSDRSGNFNSTQPRIVKAPEEPIQKEEDNGAWAVVIVMIILALIVIMVIAVLLVLLLRRKPAEEEEVEDDKPNDPDETEESGGEEGKIKQDIIDPSMGSNQQVNYMYGFK